MSGLFCVNPNCDSYHPRASRLCIYCSQYAEDNDGELYVSKHEGEHLSREERLKTNNRRQRSERDTQP